MRLSPNEADRLNSFALVAYIRGSLGRFLDDLRLEIAPNCNPHAHVSILPPRPIHGSADEAWEHIRTRVEDIPAFPVRIAEIEVFPVTSVIYIALGQGRSDLEQMHRALNTGLLDFQEPFKYHPHITLAQEIPLPDVVPALELARHRWREWSHKREFLVDNVTFVQNTGQCGWRDLACCSLDGAPSFHER